MSTAKSQPSWSLDKSTLACVMLLQNIVRHLYASGFTDMRNVFNDALARP